MSRINFRFPLTMSPINLFPVDVNCHLLEFDYNFIGGANLDEIVAMREVCVDNYFLLIDQPSRDIYYVLIGTNIHFDFNNWLDMHNIDFNVKMNFNISEWDDIVQKYKQ